MSNTTKVIEILQSGYIVLREEAKSEEIIPTIKKGKRISQCRKWMVFRW